MKKILVVDDEHDICDFLQSFFQERGYAVRFATSGDSALAMVKEERPDLMLLDVKMQGMDGIAVLKHVKDIDKQIKVVMVTALEDQDRIDEACRLGASEYITKPLVLENLERAVENNLK
ncbi:MAG: response regulator [Candidatus Omnitrophica bacterium]|nr:response regulator [Candidatus Omnitrophota bacterium]